MKNQSRKSITSSAFDLNNHVAIVTGASRGIGRSIAILLAQHGAKVVVSSRKKHACDVVVEEIETFGGEAISVEANISRKEDLQNLAQTTLKKFGTVTTLVCNAASNPFYGPLKDVPDDAFEKILQNNILSNHWLINESLPSLKAAKNPSIIIISSIAGLKGTPGLGAYAISKAADMQLVRNLAIELGDGGIRINGIAPGLIKTDFARALWEDPNIRAHYEEKTPLKRLGEPQDIAGLAVFLAGNGSKFITGQTFVVDGGITITP